MGLVALEYVVVVDMVVVDIDMVVVNIDMVVVDMVVVDIAVPHNFVKEP